MPDYLITIHLKIGKPKQGIRWHPSYDAYHVRSLVTQKAYKTIGKSMIDWIEVVPTARNSSLKIDTKPLTP